ncbi:MAG: phosphate ABC transporter substrate-binding protein [Coriobacteriaceae bacterium]|nr:phosphate ABC transporter substrate-binding protein [Coriobacteriaceae bacterium]
MSNSVFSRRQFLGLAGGLAAFAGLGLAGCGGNAAAPAAEGSAAGSAAASGSVTGEVTFDGASSFVGLVEAAAEQFMDENPDVIVTGSGNGSGKGLTAVSEGTVSIGNSDVFAETKLDADKAAELVDHEVAVVGMGPVVSKNVTVDDLSLEQLKGIFSGQITNWSEVGGDDAAIVVLNRKAGSGTRATFEAAVFGTEANEFKGDAELDKSGDVQTQISSTDNAISYLDFSHFDDTKFNAIKVGGVAPESKNVLDDSFKIWATEHMYCAKDADEATKAFLDYMLSDAVQGSLVEKQGFIPVSEMKVTKDATGKVTEK